MKKTVKAATKTPPVKAAAKKAEPVKAVSTTLAAKKATPAKTAPAKVVTSKLAKPQAEAPAPETTKVMPKPAKTRTKGFDKHYVAPPTVVAVQTTAKLMHLPTAFGVTLNPAVIPAIVKKNAKLTHNWKTKKPEDLTDAEVIAMPDEEYMNKHQLAFFRAKLCLLRDSVLASATLTSEHLRDDTAVVPDPTDRATIEEEHALELRTRDRERKLLKKIQQSIYRIDQDDYGYCDETGEPIGVSRLIARPTATLSLEAQQRRELKQRMFGD
jgi:DnaK suppressor protein